MSDIHVGDIGTAFVVTIKDESNNIVDISSASSKTISFRKPDKTTLSKTASLTTNGTDGKMQVVTASGDLSVKGRWIGQAKVVFAGGQWYTNVFSFEVEGNIEDGTF